MFSFPDLESYQDGVKRQRFYVGPDGQHYPSVTTILDRTMPDSKRQGLARWKQSIGEENAQRIMTETAARGTRVHAGIERWLDGLNTYAECLTSNDEVVMFNHANKVFSQNITTVYAMEQAIYHPELKYAGRIDLIASWNGVPAIVDLKTKTKVPQKSYLVDYLPQLAAYAEAVNYHCRKENLDLQIGCLVVVPVTTSKELEPLLEIDVNQYIDQFKVRLNHFNQYFL